MIWGSPCGFCAKHDNFCHSVAKRPSLCGSHHGQVEALVPRRPSTAARSSSLALAGSARVVSKSGPRRPGLHRRPGTIRAGSDHAGPQRRRPTGRTRALTPDRLIVLTTIENRLRLWCVHFTSSYSGERKQLKLAIY